ncbi:MAG TPA: hypothetical protein VFF13_02725 [archaeon]|nr:hypothetical protein [archaeon]
MTRPRTNLKSEKPGIRSFSSIRRDVVARNRLATSRKGTTIRVGGVLYKKISNSNEPLKVTRVKEIGI